MLTGLYDAKVDRAPVLGISSQVSSKVRGRGAFQDLDLVTAFADVAVSTNTVHRDSDQVALRNLACKNALVQRVADPAISPVESVVEQTALLIARSRAACWVPAVRRSRRGSSTSRIC